LPALDSQVFVVWRRHGYQSQSQSQKNHRGYCSSYCSRYHLDDRSLQLMNPIVYLNFLNLRKVNLDNEQR
jgi:hypothetical protein